MDIHWLSSLWAKNAKREPSASDDNPAFENARHEFMFDSLMDAPVERIDGKHIRAFE